MKAETKVFAVILGYSAFLWLTNWSLSREYERESETISSAIDLRGLGILFGLVISAFLVRPIWRLVREFLDSRLRIPKSIPLFGSWFYLLLLLPLGFGFDHSWTRHADDGAAVHSDFAYGGGDTRVFSILFSGLAIMLFQLLVRLEACSPDNASEDQTSGYQPPTGPSQESQHNPGGVDCG